MVAIPQCLLLASSKLTQAGCTQEHTHAHTLTHTHTHQQTQNKSCNSPSSALHVFHRMSCTYVHTGTVYTNFVLCVVHLECSNHPDFPEEYICNLHLIQHSSEGMATFQIHLRTAA